jgi:hypothetical protein
MNQNTPQFAIGQKIVRIIKGDYPGKLAGEIGDEHFVNALDYCTKCKKWFVDIGTRKATTLTAYKSICGCGDTKDMDEPIIWHESTAFAPDEKSYKDMRKEIADSFFQTKEVPDKLLIPKTN